MPVFRPSTREFLKEARSTRGVSLFDLLHGYVYARWPYFYIAVATGEHPLARRIAPLFGLLSRLLGHEGKRPRHAMSERPARTTFADTYHGKVMPLNAARKLVSVNKDISLGDLEHVIPYARARDLVLKHPSHIVALDCPCRLSRQNPCQPVGVCLVVGEPFASMVRDHHPTRSRWITAAEAVEILRAEDERGHVHHAFFKDAMLDRFYAICNCCACCCGAMQAHRHGTPMLASSGYVNHVAEDLCVGCGDCNTFCQFGALHVEQGKNHVDRERCMGCGVCGTKCTHGALSLVRAPEKGIPLEIGI